MTLVIAIFVLFMQFVWKYVDDLIGKGLETTTLAELFFYASLTTFPLALPLATLLSSLMTFGNLGEQFELVALKSTGMSLQKIMAPLIIVAFLTSVGAFIFSNNILPFINLKRSSLLYDITQKKPALNIKEGVFYNGIDGYTILLEKKESDGITCQDIMIYDHTQGLGNNKVMIAKSGRLELSENKQFLSIVLFNGTSYEEMADTKGESFHPHVRSKFKEQTVHFDLSGFRMARTDEALFKSNYSMLNLSQIETMLDSLQIDNEKRIIDFKSNFLKMLSDSTITQAPASSSATETTHAAGTSLDPAFLQGIRQNNKKKIDKSSASRAINIALDMSRSKKFLIENAIAETENNARPITSLKIEWHKKFSLSIACLILFFVGAPLGAIIRKGGLGMPVVVSVIIFILFWVVTITGEKMAQEGALPPYIGMWIATWVTLPLGIFLTSKATSDSSLLDSDAYINFFKKFLPKNK